MTVYLQLRVCVCVFKVFALGTKQMAFYNNTLNINKYINKLVKFIACFWLADLFLVQLSAQMTSQCWRRFHYNKLELKLSVTQITAKITSYKNKNNNSFFSQSMAVKLKKNEKNIFYPLLQLHVLLFLKNILNNKNLK